MFGPGGCNYVLFKRFIRGEHVTHNVGLLSFTSGLLWGLIYCFGPRGLPHRAFTSCALVFISTIWSGIGSYVCLQPYRASISYPRPNSGLMVLIFAGAYVRLAWVL